MNGREPHTLIPPSVLAGIGARWPLQPSLEHRAAKEQFEQVLETWFHWMT